MNSKLLYLMCWALVVFITLYAIYKEVQHEDNNQDTHDWWNDENNYRPH